MRLIPHTAPVSLLAGRRRPLHDRLIPALLGACALLSVLTTTGIVLVLLSESLLFFREVPIARFFTDREWTPLFSDKQFGIAPLVCGTAVTSLVAMAVAGPVGLIIAVYLTEYASERIRRPVKPLLEFLTGIPTVVYGYFALLFLTPILKRWVPDLDSFNALSAGLMMGVMILPMVASLSEDALTAVPNGLREAGYGLGLSQLQVIRSIVLPAGLSGLTASLVLAFSRAVGETMIVAIAAGQQPTLTLDPRRSVETLTAFIVQVSMGDTPHGSLEYHTIFVVGLSLFVLTMVLNSVALGLRDRYRSRFS